MLVARKPLSIGPFDLNAGDVLTREQQVHLPPGRLPQLQAHGWIEELVDEVILERTVQDLVARVAALEALLGSQSLPVPAPALAPVVKRGPGRPRKYPLPEPKE